MTKSIRGALRYVVGREANGEGENPGNVSLSNGRRVEKVDPGFV